MEVSNTTLTALLNQLRDRGLSQAAIAYEIGLTPQYLSDLKHGRRGLTELVARRLSERFHVDLDRLLERSTAPPRSAAATLRERCEMLPILPHPVEGDPLEHPRWDGTFAHVPAVAWRLVAQARQPYVLRFGHNDVEGRLQRDDLVLISQTVSRTAEICVVRTGRKCFLARLQNDRWVRLANREVLPEDAEAVGHCLGILWSPLA